MYFVCAYVVPPDKAYLARWAVGPNSPGLLLAYSSSRNLPATSSGVHHPSFGNGQGGPIWTPTPFAEVGGKALVKSSGSVLTIQAGGLNQRWVKRNPYLPIYSLQGGNGYGYLSDAKNVPPIGRAQLADQAYYGSYYGTVDNVWQPPAMDDLSVAYFKVAARDILTYETLDYSQQPPMPVYGSVLLNRSKYGNLVLFENLAHDFNRDGRADDYGHTAVYFGAWDSARKKVSALVGVECSWQVLPYSILGIYGMDDGYINFGA